MLKPVIIRKTDFSFHRQNKFQQILMLKALRVTRDPSKLMEMTGLKTKAAVFRTLDKLSMQKEYHRSLARHGLDFDFITKGLKSELEAPDAKSADRISVYKALMKSLGVESYVDSDPGGGDWQEEMVGKKEEPVLDGDYEVKPPQIPEGVKKMKEEEHKLGDELYG